MTGQHSVSLGAEKYRELLAAENLFLIEEWTDEGGNYYFNAGKGAWEATNYFPGENLLKHNI